MEACNGALIYPFIWGVLVWQDLCKSFRVALQDEITMLKYVYILIEWIQYILKFVLLKLILLFVWTWRSTGLDYDESLLWELDKQSTWVVLFVSPLLTAHCCPLSSSLSDLEAVQSAWLIHCSDCQHFRQRKAGPFL